LILTLSFRALSDSVPEIPLSIWISWRLYHFGLWISSWIEHIRLSYALAEWNDKQATLQRRRLRIYPRRTPLPPPLLGFPCRLMVLSCVMVSMWRTCMVIGEPDGHFPTDHRLIVAWNRLRNHVHYRRRPHRMPPDRSRVYRYGTSSSSFATTWDDMPIFSQSFPPTEGDDNNQGSSRLRIDYSIDFLSDAAWEHTQPTPMIFLKPRRNGTYLGTCHPRALSSFVLTSLCEEGALSGDPCETPGVQANNTQANICTAHISGPTALAQVFPVIWDSGATLAVTPIRSDFVDYKSHRKKPRVLKGIAKGLVIEGEGVIHWAAIDSQGKAQVLKLKAVYVPEIHTRLLSPQRFLQDELASRQRRLRVSLEADQMYLSLDPEDRLRINIPYQDSNNLPVLEMYCPQSVEANLHELGRCVLDEKNQNLSIGQKELLKLHWQHGHRNMKSLQDLLRTGALGTSPIQKAASNCTAPKCASCQFGKAKRRPTHSKTSTQPYDKVLSKEILYPGQKVSMDHFVVSTKGRLYSSAGQSHTDHLYCGGIIFVDHSSGYIHVEFVTNFTAGEAIRAKRSFERALADRGIFVIDYHTDNGVFTAASFQQELEQCTQNMTFSGPGAHHMNAVAERAIGTIISLSRTMMIHAKLRWPEAITPDLWPMAVDYAVTIYNSGPRDNNTCPLDILLRTIVPRSRLLDLHVWGCPAWTLHPKLQEGGKIPKWDSRAREAVFMGLSKRHASTVPLVLNRTTKRITAQFHVVFDDWFATVASLSEDESLDPRVWTDIFSNSRLQVFFDDDDPIELLDEWLSNDERLERVEERARRVQAAVQQREPRVEPHTPDTLDEPSGEQREPSGEQREAPAALPPPPSGGEIPTDGSEIVDPPDIPVDNDEVPPVDVESPLRKPRQRRRQPSSPPPRRSAREGRGNNNPKYFGTDWVAKCASFTIAATFYGDTAFAQAATATMSTWTRPGPPPAALNVYWDDDFLEYSSLDPIAYTAAQAHERKIKSKPKDDPDYPRYHQVLASPDYQRWVDAMQKEISMLEQMGTWTRMLRSDVPAAKRVLKSTWAFRKKRSPDGEVLKYKARFCVRGDMQVENEDYFQSYSPVVQWSTTRLLLVMSIIHNLHTRQVDYVNAFAQASLKEEVYIEMPPGFITQEGNDTVLKLDKSLYGLVQAPIYFFNLLRDNLMARGFKPAVNIDPCLFIHPKMICLSFVDDCLWFSRDEQALDDMIVNMNKSLTLTVESKDVSAYLGIQFRRSGGSIELTQKGLLNRIIAATGMEDCNPAHVPAEDKPLGRDLNSAPMKEDWNYASVVGMLLYLVSNSRPDCAFAVHQCARFTHAPRQSHAIAIKRIIRYLSGTKDKGLVMRPSTDLKLDCYVDADFAGLWGIEDPNDSISVRSRSGYIITLSNCPLLWVSKLQTLTSVSTMESEYVALSTAMRDLIPLRRLLKLVSMALTGTESNTSIMHSDVFEDNNGALSLATLPRITPRSKHFAVHLHFFKDMVKSPGEPNRPIHIHKIDTKDQLADIMTKGLQRQLFDHLRDKLMGWSTIVPPPVV
jgi:Reverse transcriptase (RNA-dependent DNA polymerase)